MNGSNGFHHVFAVAINLQKSIQNFHRNASLFLHIITWTSMGPFQGNFEMNMQNECLKLCYLKTLFNIVEVEPRFH